MYMYMYMCLYNKDQAFQNEGNVHVICAENCKLVHILLQEKKHGIFYAFHVHFQMIIKFIKICKEEIDKFGQI